MNMFAFSVTINVGIECVSFQLKALLSCLIADSAEAAGAEAAGAEAMGAEAMGAEAMGAEAMGAEAMGNVMSWIYWVLLCRVG